MNFFEYSQTELEYLKRKDKKLAAVIDRFGFIEREIIPDFFAAFINSVISQQISSAALATIWGKFTVQFPVITPEKILAAGADVFGKCGISPRKAGYICGAAEKIISGELDIEHLRLLPDDELISELCRLKGVGVWTAEMLMIFSLGRKDVLSFGDFGIKKGLCKVYGLEEISPEIFEKYKKRFSPCGTVAAFYLWAAAAEK